MDELESATISLETGVNNDFRGKPGKRQVSILSRERWEEALQATNTDLHWTTRRANLLVEGIEFADLLGKQLRVGEVLLQVTKECRPCARMDEAHQGLRAAMKPRMRGGVLCAVLEPGQIRKGDAVQLVD